MGVESLPTNAEFDAMPKPTRKEIADHLRAGGHIFIQYPHDDWEDNPCGCSDPDLWESGLPDEVVPHYRLLPLAYHTVGE